MNIFQHMMSRAELFDAIKDAAGRAMTPAQQVAVSAKLVASQTAFLEWLRTDAGIAASRAMADAFTAEPAPKEKAPEGA